MNANVETECSDRVLSGRGYIDCRRVYVEALTMQLNVGLPLAGMPVFRMNRHGDERRPYTHYSIQGAGERDCCANSRTWCSSFRAVSLCGSSRSVCSKAAMASGNRPR